MFNIKCGKPKADSFATNAQASHLSVGIVYCFDGLKKYKSHPGANATSLRLRLPKSGAPISKILPLTHTKLMNSVSREVKYDAI